LDFGLEAIAEIVAIDGAERISGFEACHLCEIGSRESGSRRK
jgi:hypothetical protein